MNIFIIKGFIELGAGSLVLFELFENRIGEAVILF
jgi:hypothetical protein